VHFGDKEGLHFDNLSTEEKQQLGEHYYVFAKGEGWLMVRERALQFLQQLPAGETHILFTHGGVLASLLVGLPSNNFFHLMPPHGSVVGVTAPADLKTREELKVEFYWEFPTISEDI